MQAQQLTFFLFWKSGKCLQEHPHFSWTMAPSRGHGEQKTFENSLTFRGHIIIASFLCVHSVLNIQLLLITSDNSRLCPLLTEH